ncbi:MAG: acyltransferase family protein [Anaerorhabdus sp.]|uniref:acyltransferase n=2 Tax=Anaerorhabdus sp. TaxID=1872524 RepID=UPI002FC8B13B
MHKREISIDLIKILASFAVICLHIIDIPNTLLDQVVYYLSGCAIPLLFMTNGYLLLNKDKITLKRQSIKSLKMLGIVFSWCAIFSCLYYLSDKIWINPIESTAQGLVQKGPMWQFWFIGALIILHLFLPLIHKIFKNPKWALILTIACFVVCFGVDIANVLFVALDKPLIQSYVPQTFRLWNHLAYFLLGGFLGKPELKEMIKNEIKPWKHLIILIILSVVIIIYQIYMGSHYYGTTYAEFFYDNFFVMAWNVTLFTFINRLELRNRKVIKVVEYISVNTFGVYAMHLYLLGLLKLTFDYQAKGFLLWVPVFVFIVGQVISSLLRLNRFTKQLVTF